MLLRFAAENILSFKDAVEFNTFPSSKTHSHDWHKIPCGHATALRMSAIYGANGAGKSNLIKCIGLLKSIATADKLGDIPLDEDLSFKFGQDTVGKPSELAIEFYHDGKVFYYHIVFTRTEIVEEELLLSTKNGDEVIFTRKDNDINVRGEYLRPSEKEDFIEVFLDAMNRIIRPDMSALSFFGRLYPKELPIVRDAYDWINLIEIIKPKARIALIPHLLHTDPEFAALANGIASELKTGISRLAVQVNQIKEDEVRNKEMLAAIEAAKKEPDVPKILVNERNDEVTNIVFEDGKIFMKTLRPMHIDSEGKEVEMRMSNESDGTRRLIEYLPLFYCLFMFDNLFLVDEIERSIHPIMIKTLISKISESREVKGQLIFTTHESCLLDQSIFRPDEIWFAQKDVNQSTQLYPLSDYNVHKTANIENGYLNGRYGGIPFLSNLADLKW